MTTRSPIAMVAFYVGVVFLVVGVLGFVPGITTHYGDMTFADHTSGAKLLGVFQVSGLHNIVHILFGIIGIAAARTLSSSYAYLLYGGIVYLLLFVYGLFVDKGSSANFVPVNGADDVLHLVLGVGMVGGALALHERPAQHSASGGHRPIVQP